MHWFEIFHRACAHLPHVIASNHLLIPCALWMEALLSGKRPLLSRWECFLSLLHVITHLKKTEFGLSFNLALHLYDLGVTVILFCPQ